MKVEKKTIVVTGGGNGMGREIVLNLLSRGSNVIAVDINDLALQHTASLVKNNRKKLTTFAADITNIKSVEQLLEKSLMAYGKIDGLINNAGIVQPFQKLNDIPFDTIDRVFDVNFNGTLYMTKVFLPHLLSRQEAHIVNISSMGGFLPVPGQTIYGASKAAVKILTEGLQSELSNTQVKVTAVFPGALRTNIKINSGLGEKAGINADDASSKNLALSPEKAAQMIINGMENNLSRVYIGKDSKWMNLTYRLRPDLATRFISNKMKDKV